MTEGPGSNRRAFFGRAWRDALAAAPKVAPKPFAIAAALRDAPGAEAAAAPSPLPAMPAIVSGSVTLDDLVVQAAVAGLQDRGDAVRALARHSVRLTPAADGRSSFGGDQYLAQIDLASVAALGAALPLPADGWLMFSGDAVAVVSDRAPDRGSQPLAASVELSLPRVWSAPVEALGLSTDERIAWQKLRVWLAESQGVELHDSTPGFLALHRLLGYPDETGGDMPLMCELLQAGVELDEPYPRMHPLARELEAQALRWQLLLQLSVGESERLYFWVIADDLDAGDFTRVRIIR
jgi:hypothetical protein